MVRRIALPALTLAFAVLVTALAAPVGFTQEGVDEYPFIDDLEQARKQAADEGKPLLVVFRCPP